MKSFYRIYLIVTVLFVLFLLIGLPSNAINNSSNNSRTTTLYPRVTDAPASDQGYISALQTTTTDDYSVQSSQLYVGSADTNYYQITSQDFETNTTSGMLLTTGYEGGYTYQATTAYDDVSHTIHPDRPHTDYTVSAERIMGTPPDGATTGISGAITFNDGEYENISEAALGDCRPSTKGSGDNTGENIAALWYEDGTTYNVLYGNTMEIDTWNTLDVNGEIIQVVLWVNFTVADTKYDTPPVYNYIQYRKQGGVYQDTTIKPVGTDNKNKTYFSLTDQITFNDLSELQNLDVRFTNGDTPPQALEGVKFDRIWLEVTYIGIIGTPEYELNVEQDITVPYSTDYTYGLWIYGNYTYEVGTDPINIEVRNTQGTWDTLGEFQCVTSRGWNRYLLDRDTHLLGVGASRTITIRYRDTAPDLNPSGISIDRVEVRQYTSGTLYNLDLYYTFIWPGTEADVKNISIYDARSGQDFNVYILDWDATPSPQWVPISANFTMIDDSYTNHTYILSSNLGRFINDSTYEIRIRYSKASSTSSDSLMVNYLGVNIHRLTGTNQKFDIVYDINDFPGDRSTVTQIRIEDSSYISSGSGTVNLQIFNYTSTQWVASGDPPITENTLTAHNWIFSISPSHLLSPNPGNIFVRYTFSSDAGITLSINNLQVMITYTTGGGDGGGTGGGDGGGTGGGGGGGTTVIRTLSAQTTYPEAIEKYIDAEINVILHDDEGNFVNNATVNLTFGNETEPFELEEKEGYYSTLIETDAFDTGNYTFTISAKRLGFRDFLSSAFPFIIEVKYPFATLVQHPEYWPEVRDNPLSLLFDPFLYVIPSITAALIILQVTTFASIDPRKLRSIYVFTNEGQGLYYRTFFEEKG
ncbi:MAG: hypothetical protein ACFFCD_07695, partial [Promethearchaeota archaeon]